MRYQTVITQIQAWYLSDALSQPPLHETAERERWRYLVLQVLGATQSQNLTPVSLDIDDLYDIHEIAKTSAMIGTERVGLQLLALCANGLLELASDALVHDAAMQVGIQEQEGP